MLTFVWSTSRYLRFFLHFFFSAAVFGLRHLPVGLTSTFFTTPAVSLVSIVPSPAAELLVPVPTDEPSGTWNPRSSESAGRQQSGWPPSGGGAITISPGAPPRNLSVADSLPAWSCATASSW